MARNRGKRLAAACRAVAAVCAAALLGALSPPAAADAEVLRAWTDAIAAGDAAGCAERFADGATFVDLGRDLGDRIDWFCGAVIDGGGRYEVLSTETWGETTVWMLRYTAGSYVLDGRGELDAHDGRIRRLVIERRP